MEKSRRYQNEFSHRYVAEHRHSEVMSLERRRLVLAIVTIFEVQRHTDTVLLLPPPIGHRQRPHRFLLCAFTASIILRRRLHIRVPKEFLHRDQINVVIQQVAHNSPPKVMR